MWNGPPLALLHCRTALVGVMPLAVRLLMRKEVLGPPVTVKFKLKPFAFMFSLLVNLMMARPEVQLTLSMPLPLTCSLTGTSLSQTLMKSCPASVE